ncbi:hypothetical protein RIU14_11240 [Riemerella anatipestifer]|uniref:hypothetical protein n=1 Tax=Riemerella anatipestifer TaxID=34085 RepID=UPI0028643531|nr:hypothetical protein [Riemerella anatipestifer]MDR7695329.1 hypothetical protein [Riemerella anatipestifer]
MGNSYESNFPWVNSSLNTSGPHNLWQTNGSNNPCAVGYHVPTHDEQVGLHNAILGTDVGNNQLNSSVIWNDKVFRLPASGLRSGGGAILSSQTSLGWLWSSKHSSSKDSWFLWFSDSSSTAGYSYYGRSSGFSVRCIKDN